MLKAVLVILSLAYPGLVYFMLERLGGGWFLPLMFGLLLWRILTSRHRAEKWALSAALAVLAVLALTLPVALSLKFYPVLMNLAMLVLFGASLFQGQTLVERLARMREPDLPESGVRYTRRVTWVWTLFFAANASASLVTVLFMSDRAWVLYNGLIAYLLVGLLMAGEWLVRSRVRQRQG